ncbi:hypothetical protein EGW08_001954 [Elysia chlorotica]|uniref:C-type lectin domain-containing protein n=1 Tax=Elysia chlorotica TaxID=188477 RepID=A0A3S1CE88_ELYCH|nr:hypothetical protein EGW08_001954 [Elysia chlorotica]
MDTYALMVFLLPWLFVDIVKGNRFKLHHQQVASWAEAKSICEGQGYVLAKVDSQVDQNLVQKLVPYTQRFFWIGLYVNLTNGKFSWTDGSLLDYSNWATGFPGLNLGVACTRIRNFDSRWETSNCTSRLNFMCEDPYHKTSNVVSTSTKLRGIFLGLGVIGSLLVVSCLLLQLPCCRYSVTQKIARIGFGTRDIDRKLMVS